MKTKLRLLSLLLSLLLLTSLWSCSMPGIGDNSGEVTTEKATTTVPPEDIILEETTWAESVEFETETEFLGPFTEPVPETTPDPPITDVTIELPKLDYSGEPVRILYSSDADRNDFVSDVTGEILNDAVYQRTAAVESLLNVNFEHTGVESNASHSTVYVLFAENMVAAGEPFHIYAAMRRAMGQMLTNNLLLDISTISNLYINREAPWYPETLWEDLSVKGSNFFITGDISPNALLQMNAIFYNARLAAKYGRNNIPAKVEEGNWTLDALIELSSGLYIDEDASGFKSSGDTYGFTQASYLDSDAFYSGAGLKFFEASKTADRTIFASADLTSAKANEVAKKLYEFFEDPSSYVGPPSLSTVRDVNYTDPFAGNQALFCHGILALADSGGELSNLESEYGILPIPKYDVNQEEYITTLSSRAVFWGINRYLNDDVTEISSAVIEAMAYYGYNNIAPTVFEIVMKQRYASAGEAKNIYDLIRTSVRVDIGKMLAENTSALPTAFAKCVRNSATAWLMQVSAANFRAQIARAEKELDSAFEYVLKDQ